MSDMTLFDPGNAIALPDYLNFDVKPIARELVPAQGADYISLKGSRFRCVVGGQELDPFDTTYLDVVIIGTAPSISRVYYASKYDPNADAVAPTCYSSDGKKPADNVVNKQATQCDLCPQNVKGSSLNGDGVGKACGYFHRLAVMLVGDPEGRIWRMDVKSMGLYGASYAQARKFNLNDYARAVSRTQFEFQQLVTRLSFDSNESVPKLLFEARSVIGPDTAELVKRTLTNYTVVEDAYKVEYGSGKAAALPAPAAVPSAPAKVVVMQTPAPVAAPVAAPVPVQTPLPLAVPAQPATIPVQPSSGPAAGTTANIQAILSKLHSAKQSG
jgi:hypothetical protein